MTSKFKHAKNCITTYYDKDLGVVMAEPQNKPVSELYGSFNFPISNISYLLQVSREFIRQNIQPDCKYIYLTLNRTDHVRHDNYSRAFKKLGISYYGSDRVYLNTSDVYNWFNSYFESFTYTKYTPHQKLFKNYHAYLKVLTDITDNLIRYNQYFPNPNIFASNNRVINDYRDSLKKTIPQMYQDTVILKLAKESNKYTTTKSIFTDTKMFTKTKNIIPHQVLNAESNNLIYYVETPKHFSSYTNARYHAIFDNYLIFKAKNGNKVLYYTNPYKLLKTPDYKPPVTSYTMKQITQTLSVKYMNPKLDSDYANKCLTKLNQPNVLRKKLNRLFVRPA